MPMVAMMMVTLLGIAAFAVDLGWFYLNASRIQRAADSGALGGVVWMPADFAQATVSANEITRKNGYRDGFDSAVITVEEVLDQPSQLQVTVTDTVPTFFLKVFGMATQTIERTARAEFVPPLPLGSPDNQFGNGCDPRQAGCTGQPNFWANIHGKYTATGMGDAFSPYCTGSSGSSGCAQNPSFRAGGYLYGIEAPTGQQFRVNFMDMHHFNISGGQTTNDNHRTGDRGCEDWGNNNASCGQTVIATLYRPDPTPLDVSNNVVHCTYTFSPRPQVAATAAYTWQVPGAAGLPACFRVDSALAGTYVLQIRVAEPSQAAYSGLNRYALRVVDASGTASGRRLYGLGDVSLYNNFSGSSTEFYLAEVSPIYRGKTFVVELYDPGDAENNVSNIIQFVGPGGVVFPACEARIRTTVNDNWAPLSTPDNSSNPSPCQINATRPANNFDSRWLQITIELPSTYSCTTDCWWKVRYNFSGTTNDTTTWRAYILGNPIHLIPTG
ncbi:MAG: pilus assembly protein TadG-related protein [Acidimicrobiia bacterium]